MPPDPLSTSPSHVSDIEKNEDVGVKIGVDMDVGGEDTGVRGDGST